MPHELTREGGGRGGELSPPLEAPQGAGHQLTAAAVTLENHTAAAPWTLAFRRTILRRVRGKVLPCSTTSRKTGAVSVPPGAFAISSAPRRCRSRPWSSWHYSPPAFVRASPRDRPS